MIYVIDEEVKSIESSNKNRKIVEEELLSEYLPTNVQP